MAKRGNHSQTEVTIRVIGVSYGLQSAGESYSIQSVSSEAKAVIDEFSRLPRSDRLAVYEAIARKVTPADYGPLSDDDLTATAAENLACTINPRSASLQYFF